MLEPCLVDELATVAVVRRALTDHVTEEMQREKQIKDYSDRIPK
jgi:hypothetical protein